MVSSVFCIGRKELKIERSVIECIAVPMMNDFFRKEKPTQHLFHHEPMRTNVFLPRPNSVWMIRTICEFILLASLRNEPAAFPPPWMQRAAHIRPAARIVLDGNRTPHFGDAGWRLAHSETPGTPGNFVWMAIKDPTKFVIVLLVIKLLKKLVLLCGPSAKFVHVFILS
jgi:hypothetical protein